MYDLPPLHWLYQTGKQEQVDFLTDDDLESFRSSKELAHLYDLIVFPSYDEYATTHAYDLITGYRNLGGNLMFLSATNFLWRVNRHGNRITRIEEWRFLTGRSRAWSASSTAAATRASTAGRTSSPSSGGARGSSPEST